MPPVPWHKLEPLVSGPADQVVSPAATSKSSSIGARQIGKADDETGRAMAELEQPLRVVAVELWAPIGAFPRRSAVRCTVLTMQRSHALHSSPSRRWRPADQRQRRGDEAVHGVEIGRAPTAKSCVQYEHWCSGDHSSWLQSVDGGHSKQVRPSFASRFARAGTRRRAWFPASPTSVRVRDDRCCRRSRRRDRAPRFLGRRFAKGHHPNRRVAEQERGAVLLRGFAEEGAVDRQQPIQFGGIAS